MGDGSAEMQMRGSGYANFKLLNIGMLDFCVMWVRIDWVWSAWEGWEGEIGS